MGYALTIQESTSDYEFQFKQYLRAVGIAPSIVFIDADPGSTAVVAQVFPNAMIQWCLWHIYMNLAKKLTLSGTRQKNFFRDFRLAQKQISPEEFNRLWGKLKLDYPEAIAYLDDQLTPHAHLWAECYLQTFTAGCQSTQRGEGANRYIKKHCRKNSPLRKIVLETLESAKMESAKLSERGARDAMNLAQAAHVAELLLPKEIFRLLKESLTSFGFSTVLKQLQISSLYNIIECRVSGPSPAAPAGPDIGLDLDTDVVDLPRFRSVREAAEKLGVSEVEHRSFCVYTKHTVNNGRSNPHFMFLTNKHPEIDCYTSFMCSCGNAVRCGVPCRHFWAVLLSCPQAAFHLGMINDLWFRAAQPLRDDLQVFAFSGPSGSLYHCRPLYHIVEVDDDNNLTETPGDPAAIRARFSEMREIGELLGVAKRAIQAVVGMRDADRRKELKQYLNVVASDGLPVRQTHQLATNPPIVRGKGRPRGARNKPRAALQGTRIMVSEAAAVDEASVGWEPIARPALSELEPNVRVQQSQADSMHVQQQGYHTAKGGDEQDVQELRVACRPPTVPRKRAEPTCKACGEIGHRSSNGNCKVRRMESGRIGI